MASNFKIFSHETRDSIHLVLYGDFDGTSALELINALKKIPNKSSQIFIDTGELTNVITFGRDAFQKKLGIEGKRSNGLLFIGKYKHKFTL